MSLRAGVIRLLNPNLLAKSYPDLLMSIRSIFVVLLAFCALSGLSNAQDKDSKSKNPEDKQPRFVSADPAEVDDDFPFQGEYAGLILPDDGRSNIYRRVGVQVVAIGNGKFNAVHYDFGLPGAGWNTSTTKTPLEGTRDGDVLRLSGEDVEAEIQDGRLLLKSGNGNTLGQFPRIVRKSPTLGQQPPSNAIVLFDGTTADEFHNGKMTEDGLLMQGADFKRNFTDFKLHIEFRLPYMPNDQGQKRGNSGVYIHSRYEVQMLDSFGLDGAFNECGALYRYQPPSINMCLPPLQWQTYDITFIAPRFDSEQKKIANARLTVNHNGVLVHNNFNVERKTGAGQQESPDPYPIRLQNHSDPVRYRNIWIVDLAPAASNASSVVSR